MKRNILVMILLLTLYIPVQAQRTISGKAIDHTTRQGIPFVTVRLLAQKDSVFIKGTIADSSGNFLLQHIPEGKYLLSLAVVGYRQAWADADHTGTIYLHPGASQLNEVVISGEPPVFQRLSDRLIIQVAGNSFFKTAVNAVDILRNLPGLEADGEGNLILSGRITPSVFIDGKPVPMSQEELQHYLRSLGPDMIGSIELITNPPARYDGEYKAIIDIKLKRDKTLGWNGALSANIQQNAYTLSENNLLLTYKRPKVTYTTRLGYTYGDKIYRYTALQHQANSNIMATRTHTLTHNNNLSYQLGIDYDITPKQRLGLLLRTYHMQRDLNSRNNLHTTDSSVEKLVSDHNTQNTSAPTQRNYALTASYTGKVGKGTMEVAGTLLQIKNRQQEDIQISNAVENMLLQYWKTALKNDIQIRMLQADYSQPAGNGKLGWGGKFVFTTTQNDLQYDTLSGSSTFVADSARSSNFRYDEYITAAYTSYEGQWRALRYNASLRTEYTHSVAGAIKKRDYLTWLPSLIVTWPLKNQQQLLFSLARRMTRPTFTFLNPFRTYLSPLNYWVGNPDLQPSATNVLNLTYSRKTFSVAFNIGRETDPMTRYPEYDSATNILQYLGRNLPYNDFASLESSLPVVITKWWRMSHNIGLYYKKEQTPYHGIIYSIPIWDYTLGGSQVFTLPGGVTFDTYYFYRSKGGNGLYRSRPLYNIDFGLQKSWLGGKLNTKLNLYDITDSYKVRWRFRETQIINNRFTHWFGTRRLAFTATYNFGKSTHKAKQGSKNEEEGRAGF